MRLPKTTLAILLSASIVAIGCGSDDDASIDPIEARIDALFPDDPGFGTVNRSVVRDMMLVPPEQDGPFYMVNFIRHRDHAEYEDGRQTDLTGREASELYGLSILPILLEIGAGPIFVADVEIGLVALDGTEWTQIGVVRYPSRTAFLEMTGRQDLRDAAVHKRAGVEKSLVLVTEPSELQLPPELRKVDLSSLPFPPSASDPPIAVVHLLGFHEIAQYADGRPTELTGREAMNLYERGRQDQGVLQLGVRPGLNLDVIGELVGDGRLWDEVRINNFPSRATFEEITTQESLEEAGIAHREAALADTYALLTAPVITDIGYLEP